MSLVNNSGLASTNEDVATAKSLRKLYFVRAGFAFLWFILIAIFAKKNADIAAVLLIIYPIWDAIAIFFDIMINPASASKTPQYVNLAISVVTAVAVVFALR